MTMTAMKRGQWDPGDESRLVEMASDGVPPKAIASRLGRDVCSVYSKMRRLNVSSADPSRWSPADDAALRRMASGGMSASAIASCLERSENAVRIRMHKLGVPSGVRHRYDWARVERMLSDGSTVQDVAASEGVTVKKLRSAFLGRHGMNVSEWVSDALADAGDA